MCVSYGETVEKGRILGWDCDCVCELVERRTQCTELSNSGGLINHGTPSSWKYKYNMSCVLVRFENRTFTYAKMGVNAGVASRPCEVLVFSLQNRTK